MNSANMQTLITTSLALLLLLPCLATSATFSLGQHNLLDTVLRFEARKKVPGMQTLPAFCNKLDCPKFEIIKTTKEWELRQYELTKWVSTTAVGVDYDTAASQDFGRLFKYISGNNVKKEKIDMTAPVLIRIIPGPGPACADNFTMSFFMAPKVTNPPKPSDASVSLTKLPQMKVYVKQFGGRPNEEEWLEEGEKLAADLQKKGLAYVKEYYYTAGYDSPFKLFNRHNEIWFIAKE